MLHRSWCIKVRGREAAQKEKLTKPTIAMDCKELGKAEDFKDKIKTIVVKDEDSGCVTAHVFEQIASADQ